MSNDSFGGGKPLEPKKDPNIKEVFCNDDWLSSKKFERWIINEGQRPLHELSDKFTYPATTPAKVKISRRLNFMMEKILMKIMSKKKPNHQPGLKHLKVGFLKHSQLINDSWSAIEHESSMFHEPDIPTEYELSSTTAES
jgi:hypothetical protein